jgi:hypothetical protein
LFGQPVGASFFAGALVVFVVTLDRLVIVVVAVIVVIPVFIVFVI